METTLFGLTQDQLFSHLRSGAKILGAVAVTFGLSDQGIVDGTLDAVIAIAGSIFTLWGLWASNSAHAAK